TVAAHDYRIAIGDLDLSSYDGARQFDLRVTRAGRDACRSGSSMDQARCTVLFRNEARSQLTGVRSDDYARGRASRDQARTIRDAS
ncbi:MAG TPA: UrcA family protein, partial [Brevundimonas sp.]|uniref:UrcA family protein n=1 Tax=Brevundimonas sp. TaxID=1871086 RepID=UPI002ED92555